MRLITPTLIALVSFLTTSCSKPASPILDKGLVYCSEGSPESFNPQLVTSGTTLDAISRQLYSRLIEFDPIDGSIMPSIAEYWVISDDGLSYTFKLRDDIQFHTTEYFTPTRELTSEDVIFSIQRWADPNHPFSPVGGGIYPYYDSLQLAENIQQVVQISPRVLRIDLYDADASFLSHFATDFAPILSAEYGLKLQQLGQLGHIDSHPIGTGPYYLSQYKKDEFIRFKKHARYWGETGTIETLVFDITTESSLRLAKLMTKECDAIAYPAASEMQILEDSDNINVQAQPAINVGFWAFNTLKAPFDQPRVRHALAHAIDKKTILRAVYYGTAFEANSILPPNSWAHADDLHMPKYDPELAKALLKQAGYEDGFSMDIWAMPIERPYNPNAKKMAQLIASNLADIGIEANIVTYEWNTFRRLLSEHKHDSVLIGWSADSPDPNNFFNPLLSCSSAMVGLNRSAWCNSEFDNMITEALLTNDQTKRANLYKQAQYVLRKEMPIVPIAHSMRYQARLSSISNINFSSYRSVGFEKAEKQ